MPGLSFFTDMHVTLICVLLIFAFRLLQQQRGQEEAAAQVAEDEEDEEVGNATASVGSTSALTCNFFHFFFGLSPSADVLEIWQHDC